MSGRRETSELVRLHCRKTAEEFSGLITNRINKIANVFRESRACYTPLVAPMRLPGRVML